MLREVWSMGNYSFSLEWIIPPFVTEARKEADLWGTVTEEYKNERERFQEVKLMQKAMVSWLQYAQHGTSAGWSAVKCLFSSIIRGFACSICFGFPYTPAP